MDADAEDSASSTSANMDSSNLSPPSPMSPPFPVPQTDNQESIEEITRKIGSGEYILEFNESSRAKSTVWAKFLKVFVKATDEFARAVRCKQCGAVKHFTTGKEGTSNLIRHKCVNTATESTSSSSEERIETTPRVRKDFKETCIDFCASDFRAFRTMAGQGFEKLVQKAIDIGATSGRVSARTLIPDPTSVSRGLGERADRARLQLMPKLLAAIRAGEVSATTDLWKEPFTQEDYITVTAHYLDADWVFRTQVLLTLTLSSVTKSGENIREDLLTELGVLGISEEDFRKIKFVTDGGSNLVKAIENRLYCAAHCVNLIVQGSTTLPRRDVDLYSGRTIRPLIGAIDQACTTTKSKKCSDSRVEELENFQEKYDEVKENLEENANLPDVERHAVIHLIEVLRKVEEVLKSFKPADTLPGKLWETLQSILTRTEADTNFTASFKEDLTNELGLLEAVEQIDLAKALVGNTRRLSRGKLDLPSSLKSFIETRWNSILAMFRSVFDNFDQIVAFYKANKKSNFVDRLDKGKISKLIDYLEPLKEETDLLQQEKVLTLQIPLMTYFRLKNHCAIDTADCRMIRLLKLRCSSFLEKKLLPSLTMQHKIAKFLHPSYRKLTMLSEEERKQVHAAVRQIMDNLPPEKEDADSDSLQPSQKRAKISKLDTWREVDDDEGDELERYLKERKGDDSDLAKWWKSKAEAFPRLSRVARQILSTPATEAPSERVFSATGFNKNSRRSRLALESLNDLTFLHFYYAEIDV